MTTGNSPIVRRATWADAEAIALILNQGIKERVGTFEAEPRTVEDVREHSVYVDRAARRTGIGLVALCGLIEAYEGLGFWKLVSRIFPENRPSLALHERAGFRVVGIYKRHGKLDGEWRDCVIVETLLGNAAD